MKRGPGAMGWTVLGLGLAFLYLPMLLVVIYSFNAGRLVTVWAGFSTRWYAALAQDQALLGSVAMSLGVALAAASLATVLGVCAGLGLARGAGLSGRSLFAGAVYAPLVMPDILLGFSLLLMFISLGLPRGFWSVAVAQGTASIGYVAVIVRARMVQVDPALEEAAQDLGASPLKAFATVVLPTIAPAVAAGWLLAFSLSMDDLVIASFTAGPGSTTLPMRLYSQVRLGVNPEVNAVFSLMMGLIVVAAGLYAFQLRRRVTRS
jgi:putrescine transport system permease protein